MLRAVIRRETGISLSSMIQANTFGGIVSNVFTRKLSDCSVYKFYSGQRYPDLMHTIEGIGLEVKASNKPLKGGEGHNGHSGWHIIVCYHVFDDGDVEFVQVEIADLVGYECDGSLYLNPEYVKLTPALKRCRLRLADRLPIPAYSPFAD